MGLVQYKQVTLRRLKNVLALARSKLRAAQRRLRNNFDRKASFRPVMSAKTFLSVSRLPRGLTETEMRDPRHLDENTIDASHRLLPKPEGPYCVRSATDTVVCIVRHGVNTSVSIVCVTKRPAGCRAALSSAAIDGEAESQAASTETVTGVRAIL